MKSYKITAITAVLALAVTPVQFRSYAESDKIPVDDISDIIVADDNNITASTTMKTTDVTTTTTKAASTTKTTAVTTTTTKAVSTSKTTAATTTAKLASTAKTTVVTTTTKAVATTVAAASAEQEIKPVYDEFDENDVNGEVIINIPYDVTANIEITFDSPEVAGEPYYTADVKGGGSYTFNIEGRDNTESDYRSYTVSVELAGGKYNIKSAAFTDEITVPDVNDNPDSYIKYTYTFEADDEFSKNEWDITAQSGTTKTIAVHLDNIALGDMNRDGMVDANDASTVLAEYSRLSTSGEYSFNEKQKIEADVNGDSYIDANDVSNILAYYSYVSTGGKDSLEEFMSAE